MKKRAVIEFENFSFQYFSQQLPTLKNINLSIYEGEKILIIGPSGSGKSTLGHCLNGLIPFSYKGEIEGSLKIHGHETRHLNIFKLSKMIGTVLQDADGQFVGLSVAEDIAFAMENDNIASEMMIERVHKVARMVEMDKLLDQSPYELSGGQKQRTALAGVMIDEVDILLFDEPLANLDPATGESAIEIIDSIHQETNQTVIIIEHRLEDVLHAPVDRIILMNEGIIIGDMTPDELLATSLLKENGIREPLYVTALKLAGIAITKEMKVSRISEFDTESVKEDVVRWYTQTRKERVVHEQKPLLELEQLAFSYVKYKPILKDISLTIHEGEMVAVVGRNGAGKSTLTKLLCGFEDQDYGEMRYQSQSLNNRSIKERANWIGLVMQNPNQMISKSMIYDEVALGLRLRGIPEDVIREKVERVLKICGLRPFIKWPIAALSYGQKKRVTIASILVLEPKVLILDEPTAGQDFYHYTEIMHFLENINLEGITILMITHDMHLMLEYAHRSVVIDEGLVLADCLASEVLTDSEVIKQANLKETSLYLLAKKCGIADARDFVQCFIDEERRLRA